MLYVNARFLTQPLTGVQRYGIEISLQLKELYGVNIGKDEIEELVEDKINTSYEVHGLGNTEVLQKAVGMPEDSTNNIVKKFVSAN